MSKEDKKERFPVYTFLSGILAIVFIVLKLTDVIDWSWFWVVSPLWIPIALFTFYFILLMVMAFIVMIVKGRK